MTLYTAPDGIPFPEPGDDVTPLEEWFEDAAVAAQAALLRPGAVSTAAARDSAIPAPVAGQSVWRADKGYRETYLTAPSVRVNGWYPTEGIMPAARLWRTATYSWSTTGYGLPFDTVKRNAQTAITQDSTNMSRMTVNYAGLWRISATVLVPSGSAYTNVKLYLNGSPLMTAPGVANANNSSSVVFDTDLELAAGDVIQFQLRSSTNFTGINPINDSGQGTFCTLTYLGPA